MTRCLNKVREARQRFVNRRIASWTVLLVICPWAVIPAGAQPAGQDQGTPTVFILTFTGMKAAKGPVRAALFNDPVAYSGHRPPLRRLRLEVENGKATSIITGLPPGRYAIKAFRDLDGDGKLTTNFLGIPTEPVAASNNAKGRLGTPSWNAAAFEVHSGLTRQDIVIE